MSDPIKPARQPRWWLNTYFLFGFALVVIAILGMVKGSDFIRDPGQPDDMNLAWWYLIAAVLFFVSGYVSHQATVRNTEEAKVD